MQVTTTSFTTDIRSSIQFNASRLGPTGGKSRRPARNAQWRPQPSGLSREELRQIVLDTIG